jgi:hypothetical protein
MSSDPVEEKKEEKIVDVTPKDAPLPANPEEQFQDAENSDDEHSYVSEPDETQKRYAALRNHQIRFCDAIDPNAERVYQITDNDIVLGRGRGFQNHSGNQRMRNIIEGYKTRYHSLSRMEKRKLVQKVYDQVIAGGARFLKKLDNEEAWVVVDLPIALQKVSHTMRCRKSIHKQLDANGYVPVGLGGAKAPGAGPVSRLPAGMAPPLGASHLRGIPRVVSAGARDPLVGAPLGVSSASLGGLPTPGLSSLGGLGAFSGAAAAGLPSLNELEAQHLAAQQRYRSIADMNAEMRKQQIIRETQMYTRMGDMLLHTGPNAAATGISPLGTSHLFNPMHLSGAGMAAPPMTPAEVELAHRMSPSGGAHAADPRLLGPSPQTHR